MLNYFLAKGTIIFTKGSILMLILRSYVLKSQSSEMMCECVEFPGKHAYLLITKTHKIILIVLVHIYALVDIVISCLLSSLDKLVQKSIKTNKNRQKK